MDLVCLKRAAIGTIRQLASHKLNTLKQEEAGYLPQDQLLGLFTNYKGFYWLAGDILRLDDARPWAGLDQSASDAREYFIGIGMPRRYTPTEAVAWVAQSLAAEGMTDEQICIHGWMRRDLLQRAKDLKLPLPLTA